MTFVPLKMGTKELAFRKGTVAPSFGAPTVLVSDPWDYVELWIKREATKEALFFWQQARHFFGASLELPKTASPLTSYYCFLNASKALLAVKGIPVTEHHGVSGATQGEKVALANESVTFGKSGVLAGLCQYLGENTGSTYTLKDIFYNLPYIHRAYTLTYGSQPELFFPVTNPRYVRKDGSSESWFCAEISDKKLQTEHTINKLPDGFERDMGLPKEWVIRRKKRFDWKRGKGERAANLARLRSYHQSTRADVQYIHGPMRLWYFKRGGVPTGAIARSPMTLTFAAMHRISSIARYQPLILAKHFDSKHNWLLSEFLATALHQFCDELASEITGQEFMIPGRKFVS